MRDIATATLSGNLTRDVELQAAALRRRGRPAAGRLDRPPAQRRGVGGQDQLLHRSRCSARRRAPAPNTSAKGSRVVVEAEPDWREWTDQQQNKREAVTFRARQVLFEGTRRDSTSEGEGAQGNGAAAAAEPTVEVGAAASSSEGVASADDLPF